MMENYICANLRFEAAVKQTLKWEADGYNMLKFTFFFIEHSIKVSKNCPYVLSELNDTF